MAGIVPSARLGPLDDAAALELLGSLGADQTRSRAITSFARGHPLALVIAGAASTHLPASPIARLSARSALSRKGFWPRSKSPNCVKLCAPRRSFGESRGACFAH